MQSAALEMLNLPAIRSNPFDTRPLSRDQMELLVGRDEIFHAIANNIRLSSPRIIALVGEKGSGRSSLVQSVASTADQIHTVFWPSRDPVTTILHQMYCDLMKDFETPPVHSVMIDRLEEELAGRTGLLPLVIFDHPLLPGPVLAEVLSQLMPVLTKVRALTIITLTPGQKSGFPEELLHEMDVTPPLEPLTRAEMARLIGKRVHKASRSSWTAPNALLDMVMEASGGHVGRAMRFLRDIVDHTRGMPLIDGRKLDFKIDVKAKPTTAVEDSTFQRVVEAAPPLAEIQVKVSETEFKGETENELPITDAKADDGEFASDSGEIEKIGTIGGNGEVDASRPILRPSSVQQSQVEQSPAEPSQNGEPGQNVEPSEISGVDESLNLFPSLSDAADMWKDFEGGKQQNDGSPQLDSEPQVGDTITNDKQDDSGIEIANEIANEAGAGIAEQPNVEPNAEAAKSELQQSQDKSHINAQFKDEQGGAEIIEMAAGSAPAFGGGHFGGLRSRTRNTNLGISAAKSGAPQRTQGPREAKPNDAEIDPNRLRLINTNDQNTALWVADGVESPINNAPNITPQQMQPGGELPDKKPENISPQPTPSEPHITPYPETPSTVEEWDDEPPNESLETLDLEPEASPQEVLNALSSIRRISPPREPEMVLNINALTSLTEGETLILTQAVEREISPSDSLLQEQLAVGRPRLSQIFNGLLKSGILTVRKQGRSRMFRISSPARDHLINLGSRGDL